MNPGTVQRLTGSSGGGAADADPFAPAYGGNDGGGDEGIKIRAFLENTGIPFIDTKGHKFAFDGFQMIITHERRYLDLIERILSKLDEESSKQVEIEAKFLEVQEGALDEISFDWQYSWGNAVQVPELDTDGNVIGTNVTYPNVLTGNTRTLSGAHSPTGTSRDTLVRTQSGTSTGSTTTLSSPSDLRIPNPIPNLPGKIGDWCGGESNF